MKFLMVVYNDLPRITLGVHQFNNGDYTGLAAKERIVIGGSHIDFDLRVGDDRLQETLNISDDVTDISPIIKSCETLFLSTLGKNLIHIDGVGHLIKHSGVDFKAPCTPINDELTAKLEALPDIFHRFVKPVLYSIDMVKELLPGTPQFALFDSAFQNDMPEKAYLYGIPAHYAKENIRRYPFNGFEHRAIINRLTKLMPNRPKKMKTIICHLGDKTWVSAFLGDQLVDTTTGLLPPRNGLSQFEFLGTDAGVLEYLDRMTETRLTLGLTAFTEYSNRLADIVLAAHGKTRNDKYPIPDSILTNCKTAVKIWSYNVQKTIGALCTTIGGVDTLVITADSPVLLASLDLENLLVDFSYLGLKIKNADSSYNEDTEISTSDSRVRVFVVQPIDLGKELAHSMMDFLRT